MNLFPVDIPEENIELVARLRSEILDFRPLRDKIEESEWQTWVYASPGSNEAYGYGPDKEKLIPSGFHHVTKKPSDLPHLICRLIAEGLMGYLGSKGYDTFWPKRPPKVRLRVLNKIPQEVCGRRVRLYRGFDLRPFLDRSTDEQV